MTLADFKRGDAFRLSANYENAIAEYTKVISMDEGYLQAYNNHGYCRNELNDIENTCADLKKACELGDCRGFEILKK